MFWINVPIAVMAFPLVRRFVKPDRPPKPQPTKFKWLGITAFVAWVVSLVFTFAWYRKWGGWNSSAFTATALFTIVMPIAVIAWVAASVTPSEQLRRMFRVRVYVLAMCVGDADAAATARCVDSHGELLHQAARLSSHRFGLDPLAPASLTMAASTFLTTWFHRQALRHLWLLVGVIGCAACLWWMSSVDFFTSKGLIAS